MDIIQKNRKKIQSEKEKNLNSNVQLNKCLCNEWITYFRYDF